jgi:4-amino-4-deoxy-L-arabinose transferase-like glycosyltransferase
LNSVGPARSGHPTPRHGRGIAFGLVLASLLVGGVSRFRAAPSRFGPEDPEGTDAYRYYVSVATNFRDGRGWVTDYEWNFIPPPGQAAFILAVTELVPGATLRTARYAQAFVSTLGIALAFWIGMQIRGAWGGVTAAAFVALDRQVAGCVATLLAESNYLFLLLAFLGLLVVAVRRRHLWLLAASGGVLALASLTKPFPMFLSVVIPAYLIARHRDRLALRGAATFVVGFALVVSPWLARNYVRYGRWYLISTNAGILLAQSNFLGLDPRREDMVYWESIYRRDVWKDPQIEARFAGRVDRYGRPEWNERDRAYLGHALRYIAGHPRHFLRNYAVKLYNVLRHPIPADGGPWRPGDVYRAAWIVLGLPGLVWFAVAERREPRWILVPVFLYYLGFAALMHIDRAGRINLPVKVLLGFFGAYLLVRLVEALPAPSRRAPAEVGQEGTECADLLAQAGPGGDQGRRSSSGGGRRDEQDHGRGVGHPEPVPGEPRCPADDEAELGRTRHGPRRSPQADR